MKTVRVAVAVALLFAFVWIQESSAQPHSQMAEMEQPEDVDIPVELKAEEVSEDAMTVTLSPFLRDHRESLVTVCKWASYTYTTGAGRAVSQTS
uniref:Uncharacterized protein n=1 Tax=Periophthalmus magnuspinnatus TaxID=409849 RepID=A0A3B4AXM7_9GOBI